VWACDSGGGGGTSDIDTIYKNKTEVKSTVSREDASNPRSPVNVAAETAVFKTLGVAIGQPGTHAGVPKSDLLAGEAVNNGNKGMAGDGKAPSSIDPGEAWFSNPYVFGEYGYSSNKDKRSGGYNTDIQSGTFGFGFTTAWDLMVGGMMIYNNCDGTASAGARSKSDVYTGSLYASRSILKWLYGGVSFSYSHADSSSSSPAFNAMDTQSDTWSAAPYFTMFKVIDSWTLSATPTCVVSFQNYQYPANATDDTGSTIKFVMFGRAAYAFNDKFTAALLLSPNVVAHDHAPDGTPGSAGRTWLNTGLKLDYRVSNAVDIYAQYTYDAFNAQYENHNMNVGVNYSF
jgi:hypothetical protein